MTRHTHEHAHELTRHFDVLLNFVIFHHSSGERPPDERKQLDEALSNFKDQIMQAFTDAVAAAHARVDVLKTENANLKSAAAASAETTKMAVADAVAAATVGTIPEAAAVDAVNTIAEAPVV